MAGNNLLVTPTNKLAVNRLGNLLRVGAAGDPNCCTCVCKRGAQCCFSTCCTVTVSWSMGSSVQDIGDPRYNGPDPGFNTAWLSGTRTLPLVKVFSLGKAIWEIDEGDGTFCHATNNAGVWEFERTTWRQWPYTDPVGDYNYYGISYAFSGTASRCQGQTTPAFVAEVGAQLIIGHSVYDSNLVGHRQCNHYYTATEGGFVSFTVNNNNCCTSGQYDCFQRLPNEDGTCFQSP